MAKRLDIKLLCDLDDTEVRLKTQEMAACIGDIDELQSRRADANKEFKRQLAELDERMRRLAHQMRTRSESRMVECEKRAAAIAKKTAALR